MNYTKFACFTMTPKVPTNKTNVKIVFYGNSFPKRFVFYRYMDIPSKVAHTKYAVAETRISGIKLITAIYVLKLIIMFFCIEFQKSSSC